MASAYACHVSDGGGLKAKNPEIAGMPAPDRRFGSLSV